MASSSRQGRKVGSPPARFGQPVFGSALDGSVLPVLAAVLARAHPPGSQETPIEVRKVGEARRPGDVRNAALGLEEELAGVPEPQLVQVTGERLAGGAVEETAERRGAHPEDARSPLERNAPEVVL